MADHKFKIGQLVFFRPKASRGITAPLNCLYRIIRRLPGLNRRTRYWIRCTESDDEFAASERELHLDQRAVIIPR